MDAANLPNDPEELRAIIFDQNAAILDQKNRYESRIEYLEERVRLLTRELFGRSSEKSPKPEDPRQLRLFNEVEELVDKKREEEEPLNVPAQTRKRPKRKPLPEHLPRVEVIHDIDEKEKVCACGALLSRIGQEVSEKLDIIPAKVRVIRHIRFKYACKNCEGVESDGGAVKIAPPPPAIIPKGIATPGLLAYIAISKYQDALPLYRQEKIFSRHGIDLSRSTMASWMVRVAEESRPIIELLTKDLLSGPLINADETPVQVLNEPGRANTTTSYMWVFRGGTPGREVVLFRYAPSHSGEVPREVLQGYRGYLQTDAYSAYDAFDRKGSGIILVGCFAHARRNFVKVIDARGKGSKKTGSADVALDYIRRLYVIEKVAEQGKLSPEEVYALRKEKAEPILDEFKTWMEQRISHTPPKGLLGKALNYALSRWPRLVRYLEDGRLTIDNNAAENAIRPFAVGRRNWLFNGNPNGAHASATLYSLIETAKCCALEPHQYLRYLFEKIPYAKTEEHLLELLPQNLTPEKLMESIS